MGLPALSSLRRSFASSKALLKKRDQTVCIHLWHCKANPDAFAKSVTEDEKETEKKDEQPPVQDHRIIPPLWAKDPPRSNKSKL